MKKIVAAMMSLFVLSIAGNVLAGKQATKADAEAMVNKAVAGISINGKIPRPKKLETRPPTSSKSMIISGLAAVFIFNS